ncbi:interaptin-like, partial [Asbolus verrucosus]
IGRINHDAIKAWFDTDSENLLNWFCSSVTEENYISAQENLEYMRFKDSFTDENIEKDKKYVESEFPDLFQYDMNLFEIEIMENIIEVLEEQLKNCDNQLKINRQLNQRLSSELSKFSSEEIKSHLDRKTAQEICLKSGNKLDEVNNKSFDQILKYHIYLNNYEFAQDPEFISHMDIIEFEEKFADAITCLNALQNR